VRGVRVVIEGRREINSGIKLEETLAKNPTLSENIVYP
jgi:hypothetical protein